ncbi:hypothetical protein AC249_AIPGENE14 [Exaiptasia diaphana]|nr:hypothetical protein AC249_AIPGENE14 [Exaiptasia diaphana]
MRSWKTTSAEVIHMRRIWRSRGSLLCCTFSPEGRSIVVIARLAGNINHICMIDVNSRKMIKKMSPTLSSKIRGFVKSCVFSPDGLFLSVSTSSGQLILFDIQDLHIYESLDLDNHVSTPCLCDPFHQGSRRSITLSMQCWYLFDPRYGHKYLASCLEDGTVQTWTMKDEPGLTCIQSVNVLQTPWQKISSASFSPDGYILAIGTSDSKILCLNSESLDLMFTLNAHIQPDGLRTWYPNTEVSCLAFTRTCQQLAAANEIPRLPLPSHLLRYLLYSPLKHI